MSIITYPLNGVTYDAEDVSTYLCTRTSGVYAKETNFAVSVTGTRQITVAPGLAWINYDDFKGVSVCSREAVNLTVPDADSTLSRIDRVVLQFDTAANLTAVKLKPGTPAAAPKPPAILQNHNQYELCLCTVSVPAGSAVITAADITDTRADEDVCGVMRDGVTGIPTGTLVQQWQAVIESMKGGSFYTRAEVDALLANLNICPFEVGDMLHTTSSVSPAARFGGTWEEIATNRVLMGASSSHAAGTTAEAGLPNITGSTGRFASTYDSHSSNAADRKQGALNYSGEAYNMGYYSSSGSAGYGYYINFNASKSNAIYGKSSTVQPAAYYVYIWRRIA